MSNLFSSLSRSSSVLLYLALWRVELGLALPQYGAIPIHSHLYKSSMFYKGLIPRFRSGPLLVFSISTLRKILPLIDLWSEKIGLDMCIRMPLTKQSRNSRRHLSRCTSPLAEMMCSPPVVIKVSMGGLAWYSRRKRFWTLRRSEERWGRKRGVLLQGLHTIGRWQIKKGGFFCNKNCDAALLPGTCVRRAHEEKEIRTPRRMNMNNMMHKVAEARGCALWLSTAHSSIVKICGRCFAKLITYN